MNKFTLKIPIEFPFFKMEELVKYSIVKKPSGVAYILLILIAESKNKNNKLVQVLENFGVPKPLHFIFAEELQKIIDKKILKEAHKDLNYNKNYFDEYLISDFVFTEEGKKIFNEESIPTGEKKRKKYQYFIILH